ncbi:MAG: hypothetical protein VB125_05690 [Burkholderia sp.]
MRNIGAVPLFAIRVFAYILDFCREDAQEGRRFQGRSATEAR